MLLNEQKEIQCGYMPGSAPVEVEDKINSPQ